MKKDLTTYQIYLILLGYLTEQHTTGMLRKMLVELYRRADKAENECKDADKAESMTIKALEQEPCDDAISRQAVLEQTYLWSKDEFLRVTNPFDYLRKRINDIPPVNPQEPKTGHWINYIDKSGCMNFQGMCDKCGFIHTFIDCHTSQYNFCPNCGCRMFEPQESEE